ncbi:hypothetical protein V6N13_005487 [Hibiscus sabdariffa]
MPENPPTPTYPTAGHPGLVPASGFPNIQPHPIHHHPYISRVPSAPIQGRWTSGLCHCFDDPVNCKSIISAFVFASFKVFTSGTRFSSSLALKVVFSGAITCVGRPTWTDKSEELQWLPLWFLGWQDNHGRTVILFVPYLLLQQQPVLTVTPNVVPRTWQTIDVLFLLVAAADSVCLPACICFVWTSSCMVLVCA